MATQGTEDDGGWQPSWATCKPLVGHWQAGAVPARSDAGSASDQGGVDASEAGPGAALPTAKVVLPGLLDTPRTPKGTGSVKNGSRGKASANTCVGSMSGCSSAGSSSHANQGAAARDGGAQ